MPDLILEVGTEEMPAGAIEAALEQLRAAVQQSLQGARLAPEGPVEVFGTPRRLLVRAAGLPARQPDQEREVRGPARAAAFGPDGTPTGAALGFARKQGVPVEALEITPTPQGEYVLARVTDVGQAAGEVLGGLLAGAVRELFFPKMMRWGEGALRFVRPIRWILCLLEDQVVPMEIGGVHSGRRTRGHRYLAPEELEVANAGALLGLLTRAHVMWDPTERRQVIREQADRLAAEAGGRVPWDESLLDENSWLVEWPTALLGRFDPAYLDLPRPVLVTAMKKHQRFFPVEDPGGRLMPLFIAVRNGGDEHLDVVRDGDERVLTSRFADARYFHEQDRTITLEQFAGRLDRLVFQEKLGTMAQKRARLQLLAAAIAEASGLDPARQALTGRAAGLAKADLVTRMVVELPALQGIVGREYPLAAGEDAHVAEAIAEHYRPRHAGDALPQGDVGRVLAVADRLDTLVGYVGLGILPSGSSDPYGLRRAAQGVVQILAGQPDMPPLGEMQLWTARGYDQVNGLDFPLDTLCNNLRDLFDQRLAALLEERGVRYDLIDAALSGGLMYNTLVHAVTLRGEALQELSGAADFVPTVQAAARLANILRSADGAAPLPGKEGIHGGSIRGVERAVSVLESESRKVDERALREPAERALNEAACARLPDVAHRAAEYDYVAVYRDLVRLNDPVNRFFDDVLVMAEDPAVRRNRLALVGFVDALYKTLADFTKVVVA